MDSIEIYFSRPKRKEFSFFTSSLAPESGEEFLGDLYLAGIVKGKKSTKILKEIRKISQRIISQYYDCHSQKTANYLLEKSLKKANHLTGELIKKYEEEITENISFVVFSLRGLLFNFSYFGDGIDLILFRKDKIYNLINKRLGKDGFSEIISGKLEQGDKIIITNKEIENWLLENKLFEKIQIVKKVSQLKKIIKGEKEETKKKNGFLVFIIAIKKSKKSLSPFPEKVRKIEKLIPEKIKKSSKYAKLKKGLIYLIFLLLILLLGKIMF